MMSTTTSVKLSRETEARIRRWIDCGRFSDANAMIDQALTVLEDRERVRLQELLTQFLAGFNSGPGEELTDEWWDRLEQEVEEAYRRGERADPRAWP